MENTNIFDIVVLVLIFFLGLKGLFRGFIKELFGIAGIVGGVYVASRLSEDVASFITPIFSIQSESLAILIGFVLTLALIWVVIYIVGMGVSKATELSGLGIVDRILGFIFGAGKIFLIFSIIAYSLSSVKAIEDKLKSKTKNSIMFPILKDAGSYIIKLDTTKITNNVTNKVKGAVNSAKNTIDDVAQSQVIQTVKEYKNKALNNKEEANAN
jgi:membrane protein required for colicin V production